MSLFREFGEQSIDHATPTQAPQDDSFDAIRASYLNVLRKKALEIQNDGNFDLNEADIRFSTALNLAKVRNSLVAIIGAGGLGNWQWRVLVAMGFRRIAIYDDDRVGIENVGPQAHSVFDLDLPKTEAVENAALIYRGIKIIGRNRRVYSYKDICDDLGENPDIVIGCTDSADFRNCFIERLVVEMAQGGGSHQPMIPELFIDYRMSLGDWVSYIIPARAIRNLLTRNESRKFMDWYRMAAVFSEDQALQEPCTERAIAYTGANVASFTGALLHWYYSGGRIKLNDTEYIHKFAVGETAMPARKISFSSRDFEFITDTEREKKLAARIKRLQEQMNEPYELVRAAFKLPLNSELVDSGWGLPADYCEKYRGKVVVLPGSGEVFLCGYEHPLAIEFTFNAHTDGTDYATTVRDCESQIRPDIIQPFMAYDLPATIKRLDPTLTILNANLGSIFRINYDNNRYLRIGEGLIETLTYDTQEGAWNYERVKDNTYGNYYPLDLWIHRNDEINERFNELSAKYDSANAGFESDEKNSGESPLTSNDLRSGMTVRIGDEICEILRVGATSFRVLDADGEEINYSLRRLPEIYLVNG